MSKSSKSQSGSEGPEALKNAALKAPVSEVKKLTEEALNNVNKASARRLKHKLQENSEPSFVFQIRPGATTQW